MIALDIGLRASVVVLVALLASIALGRRSAALRHWVLAAGILAAPAVAPLGIALPEWSLPAAPPENIAATLVAGEKLPLAEVTGPLPAVLPPPEPVRALPAAAIVTGVWLLGIAAGVFTLLAGLVRLARLTGEARPLADARWLSLAGQLGSTLGVGPVALRQTAQPTTLGTWGWRRPTVLLPAGCERWSDQRIRIVLGHELAHIRRADWPLQMAADVVRAVFWYNPLFWIACARLRRESEAACDDTVLAAGVPATDYAGHLLEIARTCRLPSQLATLVPMARPSTLEWRIAAMLNHTLIRTRPARRTLALAFAVIAAITLTTASFGAAEQTPMPLTVTAYDVTGAVLPGAALSLDDGNGNRLNEVTDSSGRVDFGIVAPGRYLLATNLPGFLPATHQVTLQDPRQWNLSLTFQVGTLQETITVSEQRPASAPARAARPVVRIGGNIRPPRKLVDVRPLYPQSMRDAGIEGVVSLSALIDAEGRVASVRVAGSQSHPDLGQAAADAVRQWQFSPTLLNGEAVEVLMTVAVAFKLQD